MGVLRGTLVLAIAASAMTVSGRGPAVTVAARGGGGIVSPQAIYPATSKEAYLTQDQFDFARPGYHIKVNSVAIGTDRKPVAEVTLTDDLGAPVDRLGVQTPGTASTSFVIAWYEPSTRDYTSYATRTRTGSAGTVTQAAADSGGTIKDIDVGHFTYTFGTVLPATFDQTKTHTVGVYGTRTMPVDLPGLGGKAYNANTEFDFRPDKQAISDKWDQIRETTSCNTCHDPLIVHGRRQDAKLCVLCHQPQTADAVTGNVLDFRIMIHKIHSGPNLPSGTSYKIGSNDYGEVTFPQDIRNCANCHEGRTPSNKPTQSDTWFTKPSRAACGACHDDINWLTGANHTTDGLQQLDDSACVRCHAPQGDKEWDAGIKTAHTVPDKSKQLPGLNAAIISVANTKPGQNPTVTFKLTNGDGTAVDPAHIGASASLSLVLAGPTTDYGTGQAAPAQPISESATGASFDGSVATYTFKKPIPATATGTWAVAVQTRRTITLNPAPRKGPATFTEGAFNPVTYIAVTDAAPVARRTVVNLANCNDCHDRLATTFSHGGQRIAIEYCVFCHNPNADDSARRTTDQLPAESVSFKRMIHRIHTGNQLTQDYTIYGFGCPGPTCNPAHFKEVTYPGNRKDCLQCHASSSTFTLPLDTGTIPTITLRDYFSPQGPATAGCLGCHDNIDAAAHAFQYTVNFPGATGPAESCATCHGTGKDWDVAKEHAQ